MPPLDSNFAVNEPSASSDTPYPGLTAADLASQSQGTDLVPQGQSSANDPFDTPAKPSDNSFSTAQMKDGSGNNSLDLAALIAAGSLYGTTKLGWAPDSGFPRARAFGDAVYRRAGGWGRPGQLAIQIGSNAGDLLPRLTPNPALYGDSRKTYIKKGALTFAGGEAANILVGNLLFPGTQPKLGGLAANFAFAPIAASDLPLDEKIATMAGANLLGDLVDNQTPI